jgi:hypothetical protein
MENPNVADGKPVTNEVQVDLHMLRPLMLNRVGAEVHGADVVKVDKCGLCERATELTQELSKPDHLCHTVSNSPVLCLGTRVGDNRLPLGRPGDEVTAQEHGIPSGGAAGVRTTSLVSVDVDNQLSRGGATENQTEVNRAMNVAEEALQRNKV